MHLALIDIEPLLGWMVALPVLGALLLAVLGARLPRGLVATLACASVTGSAALSWLGLHALLQAPAGSAVVQRLYLWMAIGGLEVPLALHYDALSALMCCIVCTVGALIHLYSVGYMAQDPGFGRFFACLNLFIAAMLVLVLAANLPLMFVGWEGVGLCSYLLIGFYYSSAANGAAALKAFVVNRIGDVGLLVAMLILHNALGSLDFAAIGQQAHSLSPALACAAAGLLLLGITGKSAQIPLYLWLPDAMAGPTPVSALIHAATMVTSGLYLAARLHPLFAAAPGVLQIMACLGAATALLGASLAIAQRDIKRVLAYSTVSQLGYMVLAAGVGAHAAALLHVTTHALFKACLFLGAGAVIHACGGEQDMRKMGGLARRLPWICATFVVAAAALVGLPPLAGFASKDAILWAVLRADQGPLAPQFAQLAPLLWGVGLLVAGATAFYMARLVALTFFTGAPRSAEAAAAHTPGLSMNFPLGVLALASAGAGILGWPHVLGGHMRLEAFLAPVLGPAPSTGPAALILELGGMGAALLAALGGLALAWMRYRRWTPASESRVGWAAAWRRGAAAGWYVDRAVQVCLVRPLGLIGTAVLDIGVERALLPGLLSALAWLARTLGFFAQLLQSGNLQRYLAVFATATALILLSWLGPWGGGSTPMHSDGAAALEDARE